MKKLLLTFASVLMCLTAMAQSEVIYSLEPIEGTNNSYASSCKVYINGIIWNVEGNTKYSYDGMQLYRMGGKSLENGRVVIVRTGKKFNVAGQSQK